MSAQIEKTAVEQLIAAYAEAVNNGNREVIPTFYTQDGLLIPEGFKALPQGKSSGKYFQNTAININYSVKQVVVESSFAFVEAQANTKLTDLKSKQELNKSTHDVFILKNTEGAWKIYRYIFNSDKPA